jgi:hypothetical protein
MIQSKMFEEQGVVCFLELLINRVNRHAFRPEVTAFNKHRLIIYYGASYGYS